MLCMFSYSRPPKSGHITCYLNRTYHVLLTPRNTSLSTDIRNVPFLTTLEVSLFRSTSLLSEKGNKASVWPRLERSPLGRSGRRGHTDDGRQRYPWFAVGAHVAIVLPPGVIRFGSAGRSLFP